MTIEAQLRAMVRTYGRHRENCERRVLPGVVNPLPRTVGCTCGFSDQWRQLGLHEWTDDDEQLRREAQRAQWEADKARREVIT